MSSNKDSINRILKTKIIRGIAHPKGEENTYNGFKLTKNQIFEKYKNLPGTIVYDNHDESKPIGKVIAATIGKDGELCMDAMLFNDNPNAQAVYERVMSGDYKGLSLGMDHVVDMEKGYVYNSDIHELSICPEGDMPGTIIRTVASNTPSGEDVNEKTIIPTYSHKTKWFDLNIDPSNAEIQENNTIKKETDSAFNWLNKNNHVNPYIRTSVSGKIKKKITIVLLNV